LNENTDRIIEKLWQRLLEIYGRQWEAAYGHVDGDAFPVWRDGIKGLTVEQIKNGLDALMDEGSEFPPNLIKFLRLCKKSVPASFKTFDGKALPPPNINTQPKVMAAKDKHFRAVNALYANKDESK